MKLKYPNPQKFPNDYLKQLESWHEWGGRMSKMEILGYDIK